VTGCAQFCIQPQLWMAAVALDDLGAGGIGTGVDPSWPAFWLPFQATTAHNHVAQWAASLPPSMRPDAGGVDAAGGDGGMPMCGGLGAACGPGAALCCAQYYCDGTGHCATIPI
jgi:hypothetical protein